MKKLIVFIIVGLSCLNLYAFELKAGDILLQPLHCWSCSLIEAQTKSPYSHIGIVLKVKNDQIYVAEAFGKVRLITLNQFLSKTQKGQRVKVRRPVYIDEVELEKIYHQRFDGLSYDSDFLWSNQDALGEKIYCSELVYKIFNQLNQSLPKLMPMVFDINRKYWERYFNGQVPDGQLGVSPADFDNEKLYPYIGTL